MGSKMIIITIITVFMLFVGFNTSAYALTEEESVAIQTLLEDARRISGTPGMSVSIQSRDDTYFFSSGYANSEEGILTNENTIWELASVSKAFTALGILLLEEQGFLSMDDSVVEYLPWFSLRYQGQPVDMQSVTLNHFLHHTTGLINRYHTQHIPEGNTPDMLQKTVEMLIDAEVVFPPGERYEYGTVNYDVLGLVIETVSGQSFEDFMEEQVFRPLGLYETYANRGKVQATGQLAQGYRSAFFMTLPYDAPEFRGNTPAGYLFSSSQDIARWMGIQLGIVEDIPEIFQGLIAKSHEGNRSVAAVDELYYGAGWVVNADQTFIQHAGGNPTFATNIFLFPEEQLGISLLSNSASTNIDMLYNIKDILDGNISQSYQMSLMQISDIALSSATIALTLLAILFFFVGVRRKKQNRKLPLTKKRLILIAFWLVTTIFIGILCLILPTIFGASWRSFLVWQTYSYLTALIALSLLSASITWFVYCYRYKCS